MAERGYTSDLSVDEKIMMAIVRVSELFTKEASAVFRNYGLTFPQYNVLRVLDASENGQNTMTNISGIMLVSGANMTGIGKRLEKNGFALRKNDANDERLKWLEITPKGRHALINISDERNSLISKYLKEYAEDHKSTFLSTLRGILKKKDKP